MFDSKALKFLTAGGLLAICATASHAQAGVCKDPWITQAFHQLYNRAPAGSGATGECDITRSGNGHWSSYQDLEQKIEARNGTPHAAAPLAIQPRLAPQQRPATTVSPALLSPGGAFSPENPNRPLQPNGVISDNGLGLVGASGGTLRSLQSVDKPHAPAGKYLVLPGGSLVDAGGNVVRQPGTYTIVVTNGGNKLGTGGKTPVSGTVVTP